MQEPLVVLGRIGRPHGIAGLVHVDLAGSHLREIVGQKVDICHTDEITPVLESYHIRKSLVVKRAEPAKGDIERVAFEGITDRDAAAALTGLLITLPLETMRQTARTKHGVQHVKLSDLWYFEGFGLTVIDAESKLAIGKICAIEDLGRNTVVSVAPLEGQTLLLRALDLPLDYPFWGEADLDLMQITLAEWKPFAEA